MTQVWAHSGGQGEVLRGSAWIACSGQRQAKAELGIIIAGAGLHDEPEITRRRGILTGIELGPGQSLEDALRSWLGRCGSFEQLSRRGGAAPAQQVQASFVQLMGVGAIDRHQFWSI